MEGMAHPQPLGAAPVGLEAGGQGQHRVLVTGDDHGGRSVDGGDGHGVGEERGDLVLGGFDGDHRSAGGQGLHQAAAGGHQGAGVVEGEHARDVCGGELSDGVPGQVVGG
ncbi:hypothetical protein GCM10020000_05650 [Streptomyces olivoverticillatus]